MYTHENSDLCRVLEELEGMLALGEMDARKNIATLIERGILDPATELVIITDEASDNGVLGECFWGIVHPNGVLDEMWGSPLLGIVF